MTVRWIDARTLRRGLSLTEPIARLRSSPLFSARSGARRLSTPLSAGAGASACLTLQAAPERRQVPFLRRPLKPSHHRDNRRVVCSSQEPLVHGFVLDLGVYARATCFKQRARCGDAFRPSIGRRFDSKAGEQGQQRPGMPVFGFNDVHERAHRTEGLDDPTPRMRSARLRLDCWVHTSHYRLNLSRIKPSSCRLACPTNEAAR